MTAKTLRTLACFTVSCLAACSLVGAQPLPQTITGVIFLDENNNSVFDQLGNPPERPTATTLRVQVFRVDTGVMVAEEDARLGTINVSVPGAQLSPTVSGNLPVLEIQLIAPTDSNLQFVAKDRGTGAQIDSDVDITGRSDPQQVLPAAAGTTARPTIVVNAGVFQLIVADDVDVAAGGDTTGGGGNNTTNNNTTNINQNLVAGGVEIDAAGVLRLHRQIDRSQALNRKLAKEMRATQDPQLVRPSPSRKVSLNRLESAVAEAIESNGVMTDEMAYLAGITSINNVFLMPETGDVIIAGPAEGFGPDYAGRMVGFKTGQATMQLQDLIVALRCFLPGEEPTPFIGCSIDPTAEGLQRMQQYIHQVAAQVTPADDMRFANGLQKSLGAQVVTVEGVPANTHFAQVLVEADYRMKLIGIGLVQPPVAITSYIKRASPSSVARNALQRWFFQPNYDCVRVSQDGLAMELEGSGVKLVGENERVQRDGRRTSTGSIDRASQKFVRSFTERYAKLARQEPVFGQLRNLIECSIVAAFLQQEDVYGQCNWDMAVFADESLIPVEIYRTPKTVDAAVNVVWKGGTLMTPIGGGVSIEAAKALGVEDQDGSLADARSKVAMPELADGQWWWD